MDVRWLLLYKEIGWEERFPRWPILCQVGNKTLTPSLQSIHPANWNRLLPHSRRSTASDGLKCWQKTRLFLLISSTPTIAQTDNIGDYDYVDNLW